MCLLQVTFKIETGMLFGEGALMVFTAKPGEATTDQQARLRRRNASIQAITFCYLFELAATDFAEVCAVLRLFLPSMRGMFTPHCVEKSMREKDKRSHKRGMRAT